MTNSNGKRLSHKNDETTVKCPAADCDEEVLARGLHLHVRQSVGDGHGTQGEVPSGLNLENAEKVGSREVEMDYPEEREAEEVARLCPYCERPFRGKNGVMIHLGQVKGRKNHPEDAPERHEPDDFPIVTVDENENVIEIMDEGTTMPSTDQRREREAEGESLDEEAIKEHIQDLRDQGLDNEADRAEKMLLGE